MYTGVIMMFVPVALALGSWWGLIPMALFPLTLVMRIRNEEKVLSEGLEGYMEYCDKVRYRLIPGIW
jgi:protein-S-isoprenylcysteine O-methyltransferase Ste14